MNYATEAQFQDLIGDSETLALCDLDNDGAADPGRLAAALAAASADIDALLGAQLATQQTKNPELLKTACIHMAVWHLSGHVVAETSPVQRRFDHYVKLLKDMADGIIGNDSSGGSSSGSTEVHGGQAVLVTAGRVFSRGSRGL